MLRSLNKYGIDQDFILFVILMTFVMATIVSFGFFRLKSPNKNPEKINDSLFSLEEDNLLSERAAFLSFFSSTLLLILILIIRFIYNKF